MALFNKPDEKVFASNAKQGEVNDFQMCLEAGDSLSIKQVAYPLWSGLTGYLSELMKDMAI